MTMTRILYLLVALLVALVGILFHVRNRQTVALDYFAGKLDVEVSLVAVGALALGVALGLVAMASVVFGLKQELRRLKRREQITTRELDSLRALTAKDVT